MKKIFTILALFSISSIYCQNTIINEFNFEQKLISMGLDTAPVNGFVPTANIDTLTVLDLSSKVLNDPTGLEDFIALKSLDVSYNNFTSIDITQNINLEVFNCHANDLSVLNITQNPVLRWLRCSSNDLTTLNVSQNPLLDTLLCSSNLITSLNVTQNPVLKLLNGYSNKITSLDLSQNPLLEIVEFGSNFLTSINLNGTSSLKHLIIAINSITSLDVTQNPLLERLWIDGNQITSLDLSQNHNLTSLICSFNQLQCLNMKNGNNTNMTSFQSTYNSNLTCIEVDDTTYSNSFWTSIDPAHYFSLNCNNSCSSVGVNEITQETISIYPYPTSSYFTIEGLDLEYNLSIFNALGQKIYSKKNNNQSNNQIDISHLENGLLYIKIESEGKVMNYKIIKTTN